MNESGNQNNHSNTDFSMAALPNATAVLVLGIISIVGCLAWGIPGLVCGIIAIVLHKKDKALYETNPSKYEYSFKNSKTGNTCAVIGVSLSACMFIFLIFYLIFMVSFFTTAITHFPKH